MVRIPNNWEPREYQLPLLREFPKNKRRAAVVWHRRCGKDSTAINLTICESLKRVGTYWHMLPTQVQARKVVWNGIDSDGRRILDQSMPPEIRRRSNGTEMLIELVNGSMWQLCGSDNYNSLVGSNPVGVVFSEWSLCDPASWDYIRPILAENGGWALFIYTPRGTNHGKSLYDMAARNDDWFSSLLTVNDTKRPNGLPVITQKAIEDELEAGMSQEMIEQEFYCSFEGSMPGAYYAKQLKAARDEGRISRVPYDPAVGVATIWDLGIGDSTSIIFAQLVGKEIHVIDYYEQSGEGLGHYAKVIQSKPYVYDQHLAPHDIEARELGTGKSRKEVAKEMGIDFKVVPNISIEDGIEAARNTIPKCWFDSEKTSRLIDCLSSYRKDWDDKNQIYRLRPVHDWSSHAADAFRYMAVGLKSRTKPDLKAMTQAMTQQTAGGWMR